MRPCPGPNPTEDVCGSVSELQTETVKKKFKKKDLIPLLIELTEFDFLVDSYWVEEIKI